MNKKEITFKIAAEMLDLIRSKNYTDTEIASEVFKISRQAILKQIPQKMIFEGDGYDDNGNIIYDNAECPNCGNYDFEYGYGNWGCAYCPVCGQALDWDGNI